MSKKILTVLLVLVFSIALSSVSLAQRQTGSFAGKVMDNEGNPLPGVTVALSGPNLMGILTYVTTETGDFRFPAIPPGKDYCLDFELPGFQKSRKEAIICNVGKTFRLDVVLVTTPLEEEVIVTAVAPTIDVTTSTGSVTYTTEILANVPLERNYYSIIESAPGVVGTGYSPSVHGADSVSNQIALDGVSITSRGMGVNFVQFSWDVFEEVEFQTGAHPAEVGMSPGAYVNVVSKSGGNEFHGSALAYFFNEDMVRSLIPESEAESVGLTAPSGLKSFYDFSATLGGPIAKDKLWFFANGRFLGHEQRDETLTDGVFDRPHDEIMLFSKLSFQLHPKFKLTGMVSYKNWDEPISTVYQNQGYYIDKSLSYSVMNATDVVVSLMGNWIMNQNTFFDIRLMYSHATVPCFENPDLDPSGPGLYDTYTGVTSGLYPDYYDEYFGGYQGVASINRFIDNFLGGNHEIKAGIEAERSVFELPFWRQNPITTQYTYQGLPWGYHDATPYMGYFEAWLIGEKSGDWVLHDVVYRYGAYFQDSVTIKNRLTLNIGLRYDEQHADLTEQSLITNGQNDPVLQMLAPELFKTHEFPGVKDLIVWKDLHPRIGLVFDVFGDATTSLKASWSRYNQFLVGNFFVSLTPTHPVPSSYLWFDLDQDGIIETTDDFSVLHLPPNPSDFDHRGFIDPNLKGSYYDEINIGVARELFKDFSISLTYINKERHRTPFKVEKARGMDTDSGWWVPVTVTDPGNDGKIGTSDDNQVTAYAVKKGAPPSTDFLTNPPGIERKYQALEFVLQKRMSAGWQFLGSIVLSKLYGNFGDSVTWSPRNPNHFVNQYGRLSADRPLVIKLQGSVRLPLDFMVSGYYSYFSGAPWARTLRIQTPNDPDTFEYPGSFITTVMAEPRVNRYKATNNLDLRIEKQFNLRDIGRLGIFVDILNTFGENYYTINQDSGGRIFNDGTFERLPSYGAFTGIYGLRTFKVSARFTF